MAVVVSIVVAPTLRLLVTGVDVSATGADPAFEDRTPFFAVVVLGEHLSMLVQSMTMPTEVVRTSTRLTTMVIGQRRVRTQIESSVAATASPAAIDVGLATSATGPASTHTAVAFTAMAPTAAENQWGRRQNTTTVGRRNDSISMPVTEGRPSCVSPATADPAETVALIDAAERTGDVSQFPVDGVPRPIVMMLVVAIVVVVIVVIIVVVVITFMMMATRTVLVL